VSLDDLTSPQNADGNRTVPVPGTRVYGGWMRRASLLIAVFALVAAACSSGADDAPFTSDSGSVTTSPVTTSPVTTSPVTTSAAGEAAPPLDGPPAPDFTLALGDGGEFTLSAEQKPVYLIFWAEW